MKNLIADLSRPYLHKVCANETGAKISMAAIRKKDPNTKLVICSAEEFDAADPIVEVVNLMTGGKVKIRASERGSCCDPSTERYWTM